MWFVHNKRSPANNPARRLNEGMPTTSFLRVGSSIVAIDQERSTCLWPGLRAIAINHREEYYLKSLYLDGACVSTSSIIARHLGIVGVRWLHRNRFPLSYGRKENFNNGYYTSIQTFSREALFARLIRNSPNRSTINERFSD